MGITDWFKPASTSETDPAATNGPDDQGALAGGLNFMTAIDAHMKWKTRLEGYILGTSGEELQAEDVCRDDRCTLGQWIYGAGGEQFAGIDTFAEMKAQHASFHACAGKVLAEANEGRKEEAMRMLQHGEYVRASERVKMLLAKLYVQIAQGK